MPSEGFRIYQALITNKEVFAAEQTPPVDKRTYEKPRPSPAVSKSTTLRGWLEDSWLRPPAGILVPLRPGALNRALAVWNDLVAGGLNLSDIVIVGYDSNGKSHFPFYRFLVDSFWGRLTLLILDGPSVNFLSG